MKNESDTDDAAESPCNEKPSTGMCGFSDVVLCIQINSTSDTVQLWYTTYNKSLIKYF